MGEAETAAGRLLFIALQAHAGNAEKPGEARAREGLIRLAEDAIRDERSAAIGANNTELADRARRSLAYFEAGPIDMGFCGICDTATSRKDHDEDCPLRFVRELAHTEEGTDGRG